MNLFDKICRALIKMIRKKPEYKKLWQNASPTSTFNPQALSLDGLAVKGVDGVRILTKRNSSDTDGALYITDIPLNEFSGKEIAGEAMFITGAYGKIYGYYRYFNIPKDRKTINISHGYDTSPSADVQANNHVVPVAIYSIVNGFKNGLGGVLRNLLQPFVRGCFV